MSAREEAQPLVSSARLVRLQQRTDALHERRVEQSPPPKLAVEVVRGPQRIVRLFCRFAECAHAQRPRALRAGARRSMDDTGATLDDLREAVTTLEAAAGSARRGSRRAPGHSASAIEQEKSGCAKARKSTALRRSQGAAAQNHVRGATCSRRE